MTASAAPASPRLVFTRVDRSDRAFLESCWDDLEMRQFLGGALPSQKRDRIFATFLASDRCWVLRLPDGTPVGTGIVVANGGDSELGVELVASARRLGLGREACEAMLDWLALRAVSDVIAVVQEGNEASNGLMSALGGLVEARYEKWGAHQIQYRLVTGPASGRAAVPSTPSPMRQDQP